jgi:aryl-phospho-beta-D-glucosidase BglC (GH1 family)
METYNGRPFLKKTYWKHIPRVFRWCRKSGIRIKLDLHSILGSQNGYRFSGKFGWIIFLRVP